MSIVSIHLFYLYPYQNIIGIAHHYNEFIILNYSKRCINTSYLAFIYEFEILEKYCTLIVYVKYIVNDAIKMKHTWIGASTRSWNCRSKDCNKVSLWSSKVCKHDKMSWRKGWVWIRVDLEINTRTNNYIKIGATPRTRC